MSTWRPEKLWGSWPTYKMTKEDVENKWPTKELRKLAKTYREKEEMSEKKEPLRPEDVAQKYKQQEEYQKFIGTRPKAKMAVKMIPLDDAVEVLARVIYRLTNQGDMATPWDLVDEEQKQQYRDAARKEFGK